MSVRARCPSTRRRATPTAAASSGRSRRPARRRWRGRRGHKDPGRARAQVVPGDRDGTSCAPALTAHVTRHFEAAGLSVAANDPYKGGYITTHHGRPADRVHAIQVELRRDLYMDEDAFTVTQPAFDKLRATIDALVASLRTFKL